MENSLFIITISAIGILTLFFRGAFIIPAQAHHLSRKLEVFLEFIPVSAMSALAFSHMVYIKSGGEYDVSPERIIAGTLALLVAWFSKSIIATFIVGMGALWLLQFYGL